MARYPAPGQLERALELGNTGATALLRAASLPLDSFTATGTSLSAASWFELWHKAEQLIGAEALALACADLLPATPSSPAMLAVCCCENLQQGLQRFADFYALICPLRLRVEHHAGGTRISIDQFNRQQILPNGLKLSLLVSLVALARHATNTRVTPGMVSMSPAPIGATRFRDYFGVKITPGDFNLRFNAQDSALPISSRLRPNWDHLCPGLNQQLRNLQSSPRLPLRLQSLLLQLMPSGVTSATTAARMLNLSPRSLQRKLAEESTSFRQVLAEIRQAMAVRYLTDKRLSLDEIALLLGFADTNGFIRAFRQWYGVAPGQYRRSKNAARQADWLEEPDLLQGS